MELPKFKFLNRSNIILIIIIIIIIIVISWFICNYKNIKINGGNNNSIIKDIDNLNNKARLTLYYADWCGFCKQIKPKWFNIKQKLNNQNINGIQIEMNEINGDENYEKIEQLNIEGYPTIILFKNNNSKHYYNPELSYETLIDFIKK